MAIRAEMMSTARLGRKLMLTVTAIASIVMLTLVAREPKPGAVEQTLLAYDSEVFKFGEEVWLLRELLNNDCEVPYMNA